MADSRTWLHSLFATFVALAVLVAPLAMPEAQAQDVLAKARTHYQKGNQLFASGDYQNAIAEFAAADKLSPSPTLEFNIALCYDRLGDRTEALRRYQVYLRELPGAANRSSVEAKIRRIEGELRKEAEANRPTPTPTPTPTPDPVTPTPTPDPVTPTPTPDPEVYTPGPSPAPGPTPGPAPATSDPELQRVAAINVAAIRDQRMASGYGRNAYPDANDPGANPDALDEPAKDGKKKASKPIYKQWWFWVVAGVSVIILIDFATDDSSSNSRLIFEPQRQSNAPAQGGLEWRF